MLFLLLQGTHERRGETGRERGEEEEEEEGVSLLWESVFRA